MNLLYAILSNKRLIRRWNLYFFVLLNSVAFSSFAHQTPLPTHNTPLPKCFYLASYAPGYSWQDEEEKALTDTLHSYCNIQTFYMNSKHILDEKILKQKGQQAHQAIQQAQPDIIISSDDNAMKYVIQPYYKNAQIPVVFCGINNSGKSYGLPYTNTTGMIEKMPFKKLIDITQTAQNFIQTYRPTIAFLTAYSTTEQKNIQALKKLAQTVRIHLKYYPVSTLKEWIATYRSLNQDPNIDFIIIGNPASLKKASSLQDARQIIQTQTQKLTLSYLAHLRPYTHITLEKSAQEQGAWAGSVTKTLLQRHYHPSELNIVPNQTFPVHFNLPLIQTMPPALKQMLLQLYQQFHKGAHRHEN